MINRHFHSACLALLLLLMIAPGCQQLVNFKHARLESLPSASAEHPVYEVICLWEAGEGTGLDGLPTRGFNGKVMFFARGIDAPVRVKGDLHLYVFDDQGTLEQQAHPIHQFNFANEAVETFLTNSELGAAYQLFVPYTRKGGHKAVCSLRVRLTPADGRPVYSKMGSVILPGTVARAVEQPVAVIEPKPNEGVRLVSHEIPAAQPANPTGITHAAYESPASSESFTGEDKQRLMSALSQMTRGANLQPATLPATNARPIATAALESGIPSAQAPVPPVQSSASVGTSPFEGGSGTRLKPAGGSQPAQVPHQNVVVNPLEEKTTAPTPTPSHPLDP